MIDYAHRQHPAASPEAFANWLRIGIPEPLDDHEEHECNCSRLANNEPPALSGRPTRVAFGIFPDTTLSLTSKSFSLTLALMQGNPKVVTALNEALKEELMAINQYFLHAEMCENWHYHKLGDFIRKQSIDEMKHAEVLIERILFLDATPNLTEPMKLTVGQTVKEQLESDLKLEVGAVAMYNRVIQVARDEGDNASRDLFERLLKDEEEHVDWLEAQLHQIGEMGYERYLSQQIRDDK